MSRLSWILSFVIATSLVGCKRKPQDAPSPTGAPNATNKLPDRGTAEVLPAQKVSPVGDALAGNAAVPSGPPAIEVDGDGAPLVAWIEAGTVEVRRWDGSAWKAPGAAPNAATTRAKGEPVLAREPD